MINHSQLLNQTWSIMTRNSSLWVVALIGPCVSTLVGLILPANNIPAAIIIALVGLTAQAFTTGALISMVSTIADGQPVTTTSGIQAGLRWTGPLVVFNVILQIPIWLLAFLFTGSLLATFGSALSQPGSFQAANFAALFGSIFGVVGLVIVVGLFLGAIGVGGERSIVLENKPTFDAVRRGWQLLVSHWVDFVILGLLLLVLSIGVGLLFGCFGIIGMLALGGQTAQTPNFPPSTFASSPAYLFSTIINLIVNVAMGLLSSSVWTLAYRNWRQMELPADSPGRVVVG